MHNEGGRVGHERAQQGHADLQPQRTPGSGEVLPAMRGACAQRGEGRSQPGMSTRMERGGGEERDMPPSHSPPTCPRGGSQA